MAGTLFGLGLSQQFDVNGDPMAGALLYIYLANSSTPVTVYKDVGLSAGLVHPWPISADANGRIPAFWLADGSYRARLTDAGGVPQFDEAYMLAIGPSTGTSVAPGTDVNGTLRTGDVKWMPKSGEETGWVRMHGGTIGSSASGSTYADVAANNKALFDHIWLNFPNQPVLNSAGTVVSRQASSTLDWNSDRRITLLDLRGRTPFGFADMGQADSGRLNGALFSSGNGTTVASAGGEPTHALSAAEHAAHAHSVYIRDPKHSHGNPAGTSGYNCAVGSGGQGFLSGTGLNYSVNSIPSNYSGVRANSDATHVADPENKNQANDDLTASQGSGTGHNNMPPFLLGTWYWRL